MVHRILTLLFVFAVFFGETMSVCAAEACFTEESQSEEGGCCDQKSSQNHSGDCCGEMEKALPEDLPNPSISQSKLSPVWIVLTTIDWIERSVTIQKGALSESLCIDLRQRATRDVIPIRQVWLL